MIFVDSPLALACLPRPFRHSLRRMGQGIAGSRQDEVDAIKKPLNCLSALARLGMLGEAFRPFESSRRVRGCFGKVNQSIEAKCSDRNTPGTELPKPLVIADWLVLDMFEIWSTNNRSRASRYTVLHSSSGMYPSLLC